MKTSKFYRLYVDGRRWYVLINADNMADALRVTSMYLDDDDVRNVKLVYTHEKDIDLEEVRNCTILALGKGVLTVNIPLELLEDLRAEYTRKLNHHTEKAEKADKESQYAVYMSERTMQAYCQGMVTGLTVAIDSINTSAGAV